MHIDSSRATLNDLVEDIVKTDLGYSSDFSIRNDAGLLYDPDFDDNLAKKFGELGISNDSMLTIEDEDDDNPHVPLSLAVEEKSLPEGSKPVLLPMKVDVARKPKASMNGNGHTEPDASAGKRKRSASPVPNPGLEKKGRTDGKAGTKLNDVLQVDDLHEGAITIDD